MAGLDTEVVTIPNFIEFVIGLEAVGEQFAIYETMLHAQTANPPLPTVRQLDRPIIGFGGTQTYPFISDPDNYVPGALALLTDKLVYGPNAVPLHHMRDSYTWNYASEKYSFSGTFIDVVKFFEAKYPIVISNDLTDYRRDCAFTIGKQITFTEFMQLSRRN